MNTEDKKQSTETFFYMYVCDVSNITMDAV